MKLFEKNVNLSLTLSLTALKLVGFWMPEEMSETQRRCYRLYSIFAFMFLLGTYLIIQVVDLIIIWGDLPLMTGTAFVLFTNLAQAAKILNLVLKRTRIRALTAECSAELEAVTEEGEIDLVRSCNREMIILQVIYFTMTTVTLIGWASSAPHGQLPMRAWYPYDTTKSPAYELTYAHQIGALFVAAYLNVGKDSVVATLIAQCRCSLQILSQSLKNLCHGMQVHMTLTASQEEIVINRLRRCVEKHRAVLAATKELQTCFSIPTFAQFTVSLIIICVTAFQLVSVTGNPVLLLAMSTYLMNMMFQVFIYCFQGQHLFDESTDVSVWAYQCPWWAFSVQLRKRLLVVMTRARRGANITAGGFTTLSLASFMAIIKASYSLFTLLQQVTAK